ncbi:MAG: ABC transporter ATP-binding protein [Phycisphaerales bacterium]
MTTTAPATTGRASADWAIDLEHVAKTYRGRFGRKGVRALRGIEMRVRRGEIFGLLGPNGAGKSTLVKILMTIIRTSPSECRGVMLGRPVGVKDVLTRVGYLPEHHRFPDYLNGTQVLDFFGAMSNVPRDVRRRRAGELLELVGIEKWATSKVKSYSKGMRQRLGIANALMSDPELVLLDEPTDGVDPVGRRDIRNVLMRLRERGKTVFLNSHLLSELEMVCDRVAILVQGVVSAQGSIEDLTRESRRYEVEVVPARDEPGKPRPSLLDALGPSARLDPCPPGASPGVRSGRLHPGDIPISIDGESIRVGTDNAESVQPLIDLLRAGGYTIRAVRPVRASLEDLFMTAVTDPATGQTLRPGAAEPRP